MNDKNPTPFWGKTKPIPHYFEHGVVRFSVREGILHYELKQITKMVNSTIFRGTVKDKTHLQQLSNLQSLKDAIRLIEAVI